MQSLDWLVVANVFKSCVSPRLVEFHRILFGHMYAEFDRSACAGIVSVIFR